MSNIQAHDVYCCLGTTIKKAGSQEAFKNIYHAFVVWVAELMRKQESEQFVVFSAMGADSKSKVFYNRTKGEMEEDLKGVGYPCLCIIRPSLLLGKREDFRLAEKNGIILTPIIKPFLRGSLKKYSPVDAKAVARFMVNSALEGPVSGVYVYESDMIDQNM